MPYRTPYGTHYHMTYGCHGATESCGTEGLAPCADCCGGGHGEGSGAASAGSSLIGGSPVAASAAGSFSPADDAAAAEHTSTTQESAPSTADEASRSGDIAAAGADALEHGSYAPTAATCEVVDALEAARPEGIPSSEWPDDVAELARAAGVHPSARLLARDDSGLCAFVTDSQTTGNPNDPDDHRGEWLYSARHLTIVAPDGRNLTPDIERAGDLARTLDDRRREREARCEKEALVSTGAHAAQVRADERKRTLAEAHERYERDVVGAWREGYQRWRAEHEDEAQAMAEDMRRDREPWRHAYIEGDVEKAMASRYSARVAPRPQGWVWSESNPEYAAALDAAEESASRILAEEGWDEEAERKRAYDRLVAESEAAVERGATPMDKLERRQRRDYEAAMDALADYPRTQALVGQRLTWGASLGVNIPTPDHIKEMTQSWDESLR